MSRLSPVRRTVDLNADLGEEITDDAALMRLVTSANVACGFHAGNAAIMRQVCEWAVEHDVAIGAQVSYDDRENFGRVARDVAPAVLTEQVAEQVAALSRAAHAAGTRVRYLKPHGALYHRVIVDAEQATAVLAGSGDLPVLGLGGAAAEVSEFLTRARANGRVVRHEGFPDRGYTAQGQLVPRGDPGALILDEAGVVHQAVVLADQVDSLCLHGDSPGAVQYARAVRAALTEAGWQLSAEGLW